jgi:hypothetical protein
LDGHFEDKKLVYRLMDRSQVERNLGQPVPAQHAYVLARLPSADAQREVFEAVRQAFENPLQRNYQTYIDRWFRQNQPGAHRGGANKADKSKGWTKAELEEDAELASALDDIEGVYGAADRKAIQDGTIGLSRKHIIGLAAFHPSKMKQLQYFIVAKHRDLQRALKFINQPLGGETTMGELIDRCRATPGFHYMCVIGGFEICVTNSNVRTSQSTR